MDSDTTAMASLRELWDIRHNMNQSQVIGAAWKDLGPNSYTMDRKKYVPYVHPWGEWKWYFLLLFKSQE